MSGESIRTVVYFGTPDMSVPPLQALHEAGFQIQLAVTNPDRPRGRGRATQPSPVKAAAVELGIPVSHDLADATAVGADLGVVVAFGQIIPASVLAEIEMVNLHFSLLPRWRGAAPVERAILAGDRTTGVQVMEVAEGLDTGDIYASHEVDIGDDETTEELKRRLVAIGSELLVKTLKAGLGQPRPQEGEATYAHKLHTDDLRIDWGSPTVDIHRLVRVGDAWTTHNGERFKVWRTSLTPIGEGVAHPTGDGEIELLEVQPAGKPRMKASAWANGARWTEHDRLGL